MKDNLCVQCHEKEGEHFNINDEPICRDCAKTDKFGAICTSCGKKAPYEAMYDDSKCFQCAEKDD